MAAPIQRTGHWHYRRNPENHYSTIIRLLEEIRDGFDIPIPDVDVNLDISTRTNVFVRLFQLLSVQNTIIDSTHTEGVLNLPNPLELAGTVKLVNQIFEVSDPVADSLFYLYDPDLQPYPSGGLSVDHVAGFWIFPPFTDYLTYDNWLRPANGFVTAVDSAAITNCPPYPGTVDTQPDVQEFLVGGDTLRELNVRSGSTLKVHTSFNAHGRDFRIHEFVTPNKPTSYLLCEFVVGWPATDMTDAFSLWNPVSVIRYTSVGNSGGFDGGPRRWSNTLTTGTSYLNFGNHVSVVSYQTPHPGVPQ